MLEETTLQEIVVKMVSRGKERVFTVDLSLSQMGEVDLAEVNYKINEAYPMDDGLMFYFDYSQDTYICLHSDQLVCVHQSSLINENMINLRFQPKISDQLLANHEIKQESVRAKRSRERIISDVFLIVEQWRLLYLQGVQTEKGDKQKFNLDQSAAMVSVPRKTLQDYFLLLRNGLTLGFDFRMHGGSKVGILRGFVKQHKKEEKQPKKRMKEQRFLKNLRRQIFEITPEELESQIFKQRESGSSDEDLIFYEN